MLLAAALPVVSCTPAFDCIQDGTVKVKISLSRGDETKSILSDEQLDSGYQVIVTRHQTGQREGVFILGDDLGDEIPLAAGVSYDFHIIGNLWFIDEDGTRRSYADYYERCGWDHFDGPASIPDYLFGGILAAPGLRTETFAEIARYGIPYSGSVTGVFARTGCSVDVSVERLFSRLNVTIDHSSLVNDSVRENVFRNGSLYVRQASRRVHPFRAGVRALSDADILCESDFCVSMENGNRLSFQLYVPENCQNVTLDGDSSSRIPDNVPEESRAMLTYLEFNASADGSDNSAGGYGGNFKYRLYLGSSSDGSFCASLKRNTNYDITLSFRASSLFEPYWKVEAQDGVKDSRILCFTGDEQGEVFLPDRQKLAVRKNRNAKVWIYFNRNGAAGRNEFRSSLDNWSLFWNPANLSRSAYELDYDESLCETSGVAIILDGNRLTVSCTDKKLFNSHIGETIPVRLALYPGGSSIQIDVKLLEDIGVATDFSDYYMGMKRVVKAKGFCSENIRVRLKSGQTGILRSSPDLSSGALTASGGGNNNRSEEGNSDRLEEGNSGRPDVGNGSLPVERSGLPLYACFPGRVTLSLYSDDVLNDGEFDCDFDILKPSPDFSLITCNVPVYNPQTGTGSSVRSCRLPIDGTSVTFPAAYRDRGGQRIEIGPAQNQFDPELFGKLLAVSIEAGNEWLGVSEDGRSCFVKKLLGAGKRYFGIYGSAVPAGYAMSLTALRGNVILRPVEREVFNEQSDRCSVEMCTIPPYFAKPFPNLESDYFNCWSNLWNWRRMSEADAESLISEWPSIENNALLSLNGCRTGSISSVNTGANSELVLPNRVIATDNGAELNWRFAPGINGTQCYDLCGTEAPYGPQTVNVSVLNSRCGESYCFASAPFSISFKTVGLHSYTYFIEGEEDAEVIVGAPLTLAWLLLERINNNSFDLPQSDLPSVLNCYSTQCISCEYISRFSQGADTGRPPYFDTGLFSGSRMFMKASYRAFWIENHENWTEPSTRYKNCVWNAGTAEATFQYGQIWPWSYYFKDNDNHLHTMLPNSLRTGQTDETVVNVRMDYDDLHSEYGISNLCRQGYIIMD